MKAKNIVLFGCCMLAFAALFVGRAVAISDQAAPAFQLDGNRLILPSPISFKTGTAVLLPESDAALKHIQSYLEAKSYISLLRIEGHTDNQGDATANQTLSEQRALTVARWLVANRSDCRRLLAVGFGGSKPVASNQTAEARAANTRIEIVNAALRGHPIGGMPVDGGGKVAGDVCAH